MFYRNKIFLFDMILLSSVYGLGEVDLAAELYSATK